MKHPYAPILLLALCSAALLPSAAGAAPSAAKDGIRLEDGGYDLSYPLIAYNDGRDRVGPSSVSIQTADGGGLPATATLGYPGNGEAVLTLREDHLEFRFTRVPSGIKSYRFDLHLPLSLAKAGATWTINGKSGAFPEAHGGAKLYQGNAGDFLLSRPGADALAVLFPEPFAWAELQDYREWNWGIFGLAVTTPFNADKQVIVVPFGPDAKALPDVRAKAERAFFAKGGASRPAATKPSLSASLSGWGVDFQCGSMGKFTLSHPRLNLASKDRSEPLGSNVSGNTVTLTYRDGGEIRGTLSDGKVHYALTKRPAGYKGTFYEMYIPFNYTDGGSWTLDSAGGPFPAQKAERGKVIQTHGNRFSVADASKARLVLDFPGRPFMELQDNREWGWNIFWFSARNDGFADAEWDIGFALDTEGFRRTTLVDRFGQVPRDFPDKIADEDALQADAKSEGDYYASLDFPGKFAAVRMDLVTKLGATVATSGPASGLDRFGGLAGFGSALGLKKTGFFHVERHDAGGRERWILVDPDGNPFFHLGICCFGPGDDFTDVSGRSGQFEWLPPHDGPFAAAWKDRPGDWWNARAVSFYKANVVRKFGGYDDNAHAARLIDRVRSVGFNSIGAFSGWPRPANEKNFPYVGFVSDGGAPALKGVRGMFDPYDPKSAECLEKAMAGMERSKDNPLVIGYFLANEQGLEDIPRAVPAATDTAAKREFVRFLRDRHKSLEAVNAAWGVSVGSFEEMVSTPLPVATKAAFADAADFAGELLERYYAMIEESFRRHDPNHMLIGSRWQPGTANNEALCRAAGRHLDVVSINYYASAVDRAFIQRIHDWTGGKPQFWSEFYYTSTKESNAGPSGHDLATQRERGCAYRNYLEAAASLGYVVGIEWFTLIDQAATGRFFEGMNGERANTGLFNVLDRPYRDLFAEMLKAHLDLYPVWLAGQAPWEFDDPRFNASATSATRSYTAGRPIAPVKIDGRQDGYPLRPPERIPSSRLVLGRDADGLEASFKATWDDEALHLLVTVTDPTPMNNTGSGSWLWNGDGIELFLGTESPEKGGPMLFSDRQILLGAAASGSFHVPNAPKQPAIRTAVVPAEGGYVLEAAIPWTALDGYTPKAGDTLLFDIAIDDAPAGSGRRAQLMWNGTARNSSDRSAWGRLTLVP